MKDQKYNYFSYQKLIEVDNSQCLSQHFNDYLQYFNIQKKNLDQQSLMQKNVLIKKLRQNSVTVNLNLLQQIYQSDNKPKHNLSQILNCSSSVKIQIVRKTSDFSVVQILCRLGCFQKIITIANISLPNSVYLSTGKVFSFNQNTSIYLCEFQNKQFAIKSIHFSNKKNENSIDIISESIKQYFIATLLSILQIGPKVIKIFQFDIIQYENCIQFGFEICRRHTQKQFTLQSANSLKQDLRKMHLLNICHIDIKPNNIMYSPQYQKFVLIDFGISQFVCQKLGEKTQTNYKGTFLYSGKQMTALFGKLQSKKMFVDLYFNDVQMLKKTIYELQNCQKQKQLQDLTNVFNNLNQQEFKLLYLRFLIYKNQTQKAIQYAKKIGLKKNEKSSQDILNFITKTNFNQKIVSFFNQTLHENVQKTQIFYKMQSYFRVGIFQFNIEKADIKKNFFEKTYKQFQYSNIQNNNHKNQNLHSEQKEIRQILFDQLIIQSIDLETYFEYFIVFCSYLNNKCETTDLQRQKSSKIFLKITKNVQPLFLENLAQPYDYFPSEEIVGQNIIQICHCYDFLLRYSLEGQKSEKKRLIFMKIFRQIIFIGFDFNKIFPATFFPALHLTNNYFDSTYFCWMFFQVYLSTNFKMFIFNNFGFQNEQEQDVLIFILANSIDHFQNLLQTKDQLTLLVCKFNLSMLKNIIWSKYFRQNEKNCIILFEDFQLKISKYKESNSIQNQAHLVNLKKIILDVLELNIQKKQLQKSQIICQTKARIIKKYDNNIINFSKLTQLQKTFHTYNFKKIYHQFKFIDESTKSQILSLLIMPAYRLAIYYYFGETEVLTKLSQLIFSKTMTYSTKNIFYKALNFFTERIYKKGLQNISEFQLHQTLKITEFYQRHVEVKAFQFLDCESTSQIQSFMKKLQNILISFISYQDLQKYNLSIQDIQNSSSISTQDYLEQYHSTAIQEVILILQDKKACEILMRINFLELSFILDHLLNFRIKITQNLQDYTDFHIFSKFVKQQKWLVYLQERPSIRKVIMAFFLLQSEQRQLLQFLIEYIEYLSRSPTNQNICRVVYELDCLFHICSCIFCETIKRKYLQRVSNQAYKEIISFRKCSIKNPYLALLALYFFKVNKSLQQKQKLLLCVAKSFKGLSILMKQHLFQKYYICHQTIAKNQRKKYFLKKEHFKQTNDENYKKQEKISHYLKGLNSQSISFVGQTQLLKLRELHRKKIQRYLDIIETSKNQKYYFPKKNCEYQALSSSLIITKVQPLQQFSDSEITNFSKINKRQICSNQVQIQYENLHHSIQPKFKIQVRKIAKSQAPKKDYDNITKGIQKFKKNLTLLSFELMNNK